MQSNGTESKMVVAEIELDVEVMEEVIAPGKGTQHNETLEVDLAVEEMEEVIAPGTYNHNETLLIG